MAGDRYDVAVLGGGPGGYVAAIRAAQLGMRAALVEREHLGGVCLNWGCIPTKALLRASELRRAVDRAGEFGIAVPQASFDIGKVVRRSRQAARRLNRGIDHLLRKNRVDVVMGEGRLAGSGRLEVTERDGGGIRRLDADNVVLAAGARARTPPGLAPGGEAVWTYREAMTPEAMPESVLVIGSGAIGMEFASFYADLGADVAVVEAMDRILPAEDAEISELARKAFVKQGMTIHAGASATRLRTEGGRAAAAIRTADGAEREQAFDRAIVAVGIVGNVEGIGLEGTRAAVEDGHVVVDGRLATGEPGLFAIGDLAGPPWLAHKASHEGVACVEGIAGLAPRPLDARRVPACTYCRPQIASVGLAEEAARASGREVRIGRFPFLGNGKAIALGEEEGLVKTVFDAATGELLGAHMIGAEVTELIHGYAVAMALEATEAELMEAVFPHPTLSEAMHEAVLGAWGRAIHV